MIQEQKITLVSICFSCSYHVDTAQKGLYSLQAVKE